MNFTLPPRKTKKGKIKVLTCICTKIPGSSSHVYVNGYVIPQKEMVPLNDKDLISLGGNHAVDEVQGEKRLFVYRLIILRKSLLLKNFIKNYLIDYSTQLLMFRYSKKATKF